MLPLGSLPQPNAAASPKLVDYQQGGSGVGVWQLLKAQPQPALRGLVDGYLGWQTLSPDAVCRRVVPAAVVPLLIELSGGSWQLYSAEREHCTHQSFVAGLHQRFGLLHTPAAATCLQIELTPLGAYRLFGGAMGALADTSADLGELFGSEGLRLHGRLLEAQSWYQVLQMIDHFIAQRVTLNPPPSVQLQWAWQQLTLSHGSVRIGDLTAQLGWTRKRLRAAFREHLGVSAKAAAQLLRFSEASLRLRTEGAGARGALLAQQCGYADQAHLCREFRRFSGWSPIEYLRNVNRDGVAVAEPSA